MTFWFLPAAGLGLGMWMLVLSVLPRRASLAEGLARLRLTSELPPIVVPTEAPANPLAGAGAPLARLLLRRPGDLSLRLLGGLVAAEDLTLMGQTLERHIAEKLATGLLGLLVPLAGDSLLLGAGALGGVNLGFAVVVPAWMAVLLAVGGFVAPDLVLRSNARTRRREIDDGLTVFAQTVAMSLTANKGVEAALQDGASAGDSWIFPQLRRALAQASFGHERPWDTIGRLGKELGIDLLEQLAARISLAGEDGARIADSLATFAESLRTRRLTQIEAEQQIVSEKMAAVGVLPLLALALFLGAPGFFRILSGH